MNVQILETTKLETYDVNNKTWNLSNDPKTNGSTEVTKLNQNGNNLDPSLELVRIRGDQYRLILCDIPGALEILLQGQHIVRQTVTQRFIVTDTVTKQTVEIDQRITDGLKINANGSYELFDPAPQEILGPPRPRP